VAFLATAWTATTVEPTIKERLRINATRPCSGSTQSKTHVPKEQLTHLNSASGMTIEHVMFFLITMNSNSNIILFNY